MKENYRLQKLWQTVGDYELHYGEQLLRGGITRPVLIIVSKNPLPTTTLTKLLPFSEAGVIGELYDCGVDDAGTWLVFSRVVGTLSQRQQATPTAPKMVRQMLGELLRKLAFLHSVTPPVIYQQLTPANIFVAADETLTLNPLPLIAALSAVAPAPLTASGANNQYCAPELLDAEIGDLGTGGDLYALGMIIYELALGKKLFSEQFPAVYGDGDDQKSINEKWLYWHVSPQLTLPPLKNIIADFPADLSEIIERLTRKPLDERRIATALWLEKINWSGANEVIKLAPVPTEKKSLLTPLAKILCGVIGIICLLGMAALWSLKTGEPRLTLAEKNYRVESPMVALTGKVVNLPPAAQLAITARNNLINTRTYAEVDTQSGKFTAMLPLPVLGEYQAYGSVIDAQGEILTRWGFTILRQPPTDIAIKFITHPPAYAATLELNYYETLDEKTRLEVVNRLVTDEQGIATTTVPYGKNGEYGFSLEHPAFLRLHKTLNTGIDNDSVQEINLTPLSEREIKHKLQALLNEREVLKEKAANGDAAAIARLAEIEREIKRFNKPEQFIEQEKEKAERAALQQRIAELKSKGELTPEEVRELAAAQARLAEITHKSPDEASENIDDATTNNSAMEISAAMSAQLSKLDEDYAAQRVAILHDPHLSPAEKTARLTALATKYNADKAAISAAGLSTATQAQLQKLDEDYAAQRAAILQDPHLSPAEKTARLTALAEKYNADKAAILAAAKTENAIIAAPPKIALALSTAEIASMPLAKLRWYIEEILPQYAIKVSENVAVDRLNVSGYVLDQESYDILTTRLAPALPRLIIDLRIDPNVITADLRAMFADLGLNDNLVHPLLVGPHHRLFIGVSPTANAPTVKKIEAIVANFVASMKLVTIEKLPSNLEIKK